MAGAGFLDAHADEVYRLEADDLYLTGTSEVALAGYHADEILDLSDGPKRYAGWSTCYRREAGLATARTPAASSGCTSSTRSRCSVYCRPEDAAAEHQRLLDWEKEMLAKIEVPYRVIDTAAGDLGGPAARKFDCEAWVPDPGPLPRADLDLELHDLPGAPAQHPRARRRAAAPGTWRRSTAPWPPPAGSSPSWRTTSRPDGSVVVPEALRPYLGLDVLTPQG